MKKELKDKIAFSVDPEILRRLDAMVEAGKAKSRSHAIEILLKKGLGDSVERKALVLAGGKNAGNALIEYKKKTVLARIIEQLAKSGVREVVLVGGRALEESMKGIAQGIKTSILLEEKPLGTAGAMSLAKGLFDSSFLVFYADVVCDFNIASLLEQHEREKPVATLALTEVENASKYGAVEMEGLKVKGFVEKPAPGKEPSNLVNAGIYVFDPKIFEFLPKKGSLERDVLPGLAKAGLVQGFVFTGEWLDVSRQAKK